MHLDTELSLYGTGYLALGAGLASQLVAQHPRASVPVHPSYVCSHPLHDRHGQPWRSFRATLRDVEQLPEAGWLTGRVLLDVDGRQVDGMKWVTWYAGSPTDWPTGLVSFRDYVQLDPGTGREIGPGPVWTLAIRALHGMA